MNFLTQILLLLHIFQCLKIAESRELEEIPTTIGTTQHFLATLTGSASENCSESYPRLFYTPNPSDYIIKFNTPTHNCYVDVDISKKEFTYILYGEGNSKVNGGKFHKGNVRTEKEMEVKHSPMYKVWIPQKEEFNMVVVADWGPIRARNYQPIYPSLISRIASEELHAILIVGDVAYDLASDECKQYELFMSELATVSPYLPIIPILGNHETFSENNIKIFKESFECYNLSSPQRVQSYIFGSFRLVTFNPFLEIYGRSTDELYSKLRETILNEVNSKGKNEFVVLSSHYPLICSQIDTHCRDTIKKLSGMFEDLGAMKSVDLYIGAHMHEYERVVPYDGKKFVEGRMGPYGKGEMASVVEAVAGNDLGIIDEDFEVEKFSISHSYNKTGYGVLNIWNMTGSPSAKYTHYVTITAAETKIFDQALFITAKSEK